MATPFSLIFLIFSLQVELVSSLSSIDVAAVSQTTVAPTITDPPTYLGDVPISSAHAATATVPTMTYETAVRILDECTLQEQPCHGQLYSAVRYLEQHGCKLYSDPSKQQALCARAQGSWKLVLSTGNAKIPAFHTQPHALLPFSFAMIQGDYFGNGFGWNQDSIWVSVLQKHHYKPKIRQLVVTVQDVYLGGHKATHVVPSFVKQAIHLGKTPQDFDANQERPPAFCLVAATQHALVARGNQSGALAIWKRLPRDVLPSAYKDLTV